MKTLMATTLFLLFAMTASGASAQLVRCESVFFETSSGNSFSVTDKIFNAFYGIKKPKIIKQLDVREYESYLRMLRENRQDVPASKAEHYVALLDHHYELFQFQFHQLPVLTQKKILKELKAYANAKSHDSKDVVELVNTLTNGTTEKPLTLFKVIELARNKDRYELLLKQYSQQFIFMNLVNDLFVNHGQKPIVNEAQFTQLRRWYRKNAEYVNVSLMSSLQLVLNVMDPSGIYMTEINLTKIHKFRHHVEKALNEGLTYEQTLSGDRYIKDMLRSDVEYRVVQSTVNTAFWLSLFYILFSDD